MNYLIVAGYGIIPLKIPSSPATHCTLHTTVGCVGNDECTSKSHSVIRLLGPVRDVIVRPARHHYRPGETSEFVFSLILIFPMIVLYMGIYIKFVRLKIR